MAAGDARVVVKFCPKTGNASPGDRVPVPKPSLLESGGFGFRLSIPAMLNEAAEVNEPGKMKTTDPEA
jgi:hypothetical protein